MIVPELLRSSHGSTAPIHLRQGSLGKAAPACFPLPVSNC
jgi:hypothetical protein